MFTTKEGIAKVSKKVHGLASASRRAERLKAALANLSADINGLREELAQSGDSPIAAAVFEQFVGNVATGNALLDQFKTQVAADRQATVDEALTTAVLSEVLTDIVEGYRRDPQSSRHIASSAGRTNDVRYLTNQRRRTLGERGTSAWDVLEAVHPFGMQLTLSDMLTKFFSEDAMALLRETCPNDYWLAIVGRDSMQAKRGTFDAWPYPEFGQPRIQPAQYSRQDVERALNAIRFNVPLKDIAGKPVSAWPEAIRMQLTLDNGLLLTETRNGTPPAVVVNPILQRQLDRIEQEHQHSGQAAAGGESPRD